MADGNVFFGGGSWGLVEIDKPLMTPMLHERHALSGNLSNSSSIIKGSGISESLTYNTVSNRWIKIPDSIGVGTATSRPLRWYPTVTRLADSRMMLTGGYENVLPVPEPHNGSVEVFDPVTNTWSITSNFSDTPEGIANPDYTHVYQFPMDYVGGTRYDMVMMLGGTAEPLFLFMNGRQSGWHPSGGKLRPGAQLFIDSSAPAKKKLDPNRRSSSAMLPIRLPEARWGYTNGSVRTVGGEHQSLMEGNIDVYDPGLNQWRPSIPMTGRRHHPNVTILPDGRMLILAGYAGEGIDQTGYAEYVDPKNNFAHSVGVAHMP